MYVYVYVYVYVCVYIYIHVFVYVYVYVYFTIDIVVLYTYNPIPPNHRKPWLLVMHSRHFSTRPPFFMVLCLAEARGPDPRCGSRVAPCRAHLRDQREE